MVTVHRFETLRFVIYSNDHDPAHVHVLRVRDARQKSSWLGHRRSSFGSMALAPVN
jgi:hypothetical protein